MIFFFFFGQIENKVAGPAQKNMYGWEALNTANFFAFFGPKLIFDILVDFSVAMGYENQML